MPVIKPIIPFIRRRKPKERIAGPTPPATLNLTAAELYQSDDLLLILTFDRAVDAAALDPAQITGQDGRDSGQTFIGSTLDDQPEPDTLVIKLQFTGPATGENDLLSATADTGIVAIDDGGTWAGVTDVELPYP